MKIEKSRTEFFQEGQAVVNTVSSLTLRVILKLSVLMLIVATGNLRAAAAAKNWVGGASGNPNDWNTASNWSPAGVPGAGDDVAIPGSRASYPVLSTAAANAVHSVSVNSGGSLTITSGGSLVTTTGPASVSIDGTLTMSGGTLTAFQDIRGSGRITMNGGTLQVGHDWHLAPTNFSATGGTVEWTGEVGNAGPGGFPGGTGAYQFFNVLVDTGVDPGFDNHANTFRVTGNWINNGSARLTGQATTVQFAGSNPQTIGGSSSTTFKNLIVNNAAGVALTANVTVNGTLTFTTGVMSAGANRLILPVGATVSGAGNGWVNGLVQKAFANGAGQSFSFPVGDASNYAPINLTSLNVTTAGSLAASTTGGDYPNVTASGINPTRSVNRYWTLTNSPSGIVLTAGSATFNFVASDVDAGASAADFAVRRFNGVWSAPTNATLSGTSATVGLPSFGDFAIGDLGAAANSQLTSCCTMPNSHALVGLSGNPNWTYSILASTDLVNWTKIGSATTGTNGLCQFEDVDAASFPVRFYRACSP